MFMAPKLLASRRPPQGTSEIIVGYMHRISRPAYVGIVSAYINWSIERTEELFDELEQKGTVRLLTDDEKKSMKMDIRAKLYVLTETAHPSKARW